MRDQWIKKPIPKSKAKNSYILFDKEDEKAKLVSYDRIVAKADVYTGDISVSANLTLREKKHFERFIEWVHGASMCESITIHTYISSSHKISHELMLDYIERYDIF